MAVSGDMGRFFYMKMTKPKQGSWNGTKKPENPLAGRFSAQRNALNDDQDAWKENRLLSSGNTVKGQGLFGYQN